MFTKYISLSLGLSEFLYGFTGPVQVRGGRVVIARPRVTGRKRFGLFLCLYALCLANTGVTLHTAYGHKG